MKKWTNRGHEFDALGKRFKKKPEILLIGDKSECERIREKLLFLGVKIDISPIEQFKTIGNIQKFILGYRFKSKTILVVDSNPYESGLFISGIEKNFSLKRNEDIFWINDFLDYYLSIFAVYVAEKIYFSSNSFICTTVCNLNCKNCLNFKPYDRNLQHYNIDSLKKSVDLYFSVIDRVGLFHISGGEPFLYPHLNELLTYIGEKYRDKIDILGTVTNTTVIPDDTLCEILKKYNIRVEVDDYTKTIPQLKNNYNNLVKKLKEFCIWTQINVAGVNWKWFSVLPSKKDWTNATEEMLIKKFNDCNNPFMEFKKDKIHLCCYSEFAAQAGLITQNSTELYDISKFNNKNKKELIEFRLGYSEKGYAEFCKYCNGLPVINPTAEVPAEQASGKLSWDKNTPCQLG